MENKTMFQIWKEINPDYPLSEKEFLLDLTKNIRRECTFIIPTDDDSFTLDVNIGYAEKISKKWCEEEILKIHPEFILQAAYVINKIDLAKLQIDIVKLSRYDNNNTSKEALEKIKDLMIDKNMIDNKCIVEDIGIICKCRKIKYKKNHFSEDGVINNDSFKEEREEDIRIYKKERRFYESENFSSSAAPVRVKTKNQYALECISIDDYSETAIEFNQKGTDVYAFIRRSGVDFLQDKTFEINYKYSKEKTVKIFVDNELVNELNIRIDTEEIVDLTTYHYNYQQQIAKIEYDKKIFTAKFIAKSDEYKRDKATLTVKILKDISNNSDLTIRLKTTKLENRDTVLE